MGNNISRIGLDFFSKLSIYKTVNAGVPQFACYPITATTANITATQCPSTSASLGMYACMHIL
jgi:hypothetical protein